MKNTHRHSIGLELFFSTRSGTFSGLNECTASDVDRLAEENILTRMAVAHEICSALQDYRQAGCPEDLIPENIRQFGSSMKRCAEPQSIRTFFGWLIDVARRNEADRVERVSSLNTAAARYEGAAASFIRTGLALNNQRVFIKRTGDTLSMSYAERDWGRVRVSFTGCEYTIGFPECIPGYAFSTEAEKDNDRLRFRLLIDTLFSGNDYCERLMQPMGWHELEFICSDVSVEITACDYAARLELMGTPRAEMVDRICSALLNKHYILGNGGLSSSEQAMLPAASFISGSGNLLTKKKDQRWLDEQMVLEALDNRYAMQQLHRLLEDSQCGELAKRFDFCTEARYEDDEQSALKNSRLYSGLYELHIADGRARPLLIELCRRLREMTAGFSGSTPRMNAEADIAARVKKAVENDLSELKFEGSYPHYSRQTNRGTEYLSLMFMPASDAPRRGVYSYYVTLAAAKTQLTAKKSSANATVGTANALDCHPELNGSSLYGELAGSDDGQYINMDSDSFAKHRALRDDSKGLGQYIRLADHQFCRGRLPAGYAAGRLIHSTLPSPFLRLLFTTLPLCAALSLLVLVGYLLLTEPLGLPMLSPTQAFGGASVLCAASTLLVTVARRFYHAGRLWRYR